MEHIKKNSIMTKRIYKG